MRLELMQEFYKLNNNDNFIIYLKYKNQLTNIFLDETTNDFLLQIILATSYTNTYQWIRI